MVTPCSSASGLILFSASTQLAVASSSGIPRRLPKKVMRFGTLFAAASGMPRSRLASVLAWFALTLSPSTMVPPKPEPIEQVSPYSRATGHSASVRRSIAVRPMSATALQNSGSGILAKGQRQTDCFSRAFATCR